MKKIINSSLVMGIFLTITTVAIAQNQPIPGIDSFRYGPFSNSGLRSIESLQCNDVTTTIWITVPVGPFFSIPVPVTSTTEVCDWVCTTNCD